ncbi:MAG: hypothetical protein INH34_04655 [Phycisphaerales bacterium]|nr:hypothetical protein [Phycisphaerales bacterium]
MTLALRAGALAALFAAGVAAQDVLSGNRGTARDADAAADDRIGALHLLVMAGGLDPATGVAALAAADERVALAAAALVRHRVALDDAWFSALDANAPAARRLLDELAIAPRPSADAWLARWAARPERSPDDRCRALAGRSGDWSAADRDTFLAALLADPAGDGVAAARRVLPARLADGLVGRLHQELVAGRLPLDEALRVFDRLSPQGVRALLGLALQLPEPACATLLRHVHDQRPELVVERVATAVDDAANPVDVRWLRYAAPLLATPARIGRVVALLGDAAARDEAFAALLAARVVAPAVLAFAAPADDAEAARVRIARLLDRAIDAVPAATLRDWLARGDGVGETVALFLPRRRVLDPELARDLFVRLQQAGTVDGRFCRPAALAVVGGGDEGVVRALWPLVRTTAEDAPFVEALVGRRPAAPFARLLLRSDAEQAVVGLTPAERDERRWRALHGAAALGDVAAVPQLVAVARSLPADIVRRCAALPGPLPAGQAHALLDAVGVPRYAPAGDEGVWGTVGAPEAPAADLGSALELLAWAARGGDDATVAARLLAFWRDPSPTEALRDLQPEVAPAVLRGPFGAPLRDELRARLAAGPLDAAAEALAFAVVESLAEPLDAAALALCAEIVFAMPRADRAGEAARAARWPDGRGGFALVGAVAQRLRGAAPDAVAAAFGAAVQAACADPAGAAATAARARALLVATGRAPAVRAALLPAIAPWLRTIAVDQGVWPLLVAAWARTTAALDRGDPGGARFDLGLALRLLHEPIGDPDLRRDLLGERDPGADVDPHAALACLPHRVAYMDARAADDAAAMALARASWREFAGRDAATIAALPDPIPETRR